jgi:hypothetical protein
VAASVASQSMRYRLLALALLIAACAHRSGTSFTSRPTLYCAACEFGKAPSMLSTYTALMVTTLWYGECWTSEKGYWFFALGDDDKTFRSFPCKIIDHTPAVRCVGVGGGCTVTPVDPATAKARSWPHGPAGGNERYFEVLVTSPGTYQLEGQFVHRKGKATERLTLRVVRPAELLEVACRASESDATKARIDFTLSYPDVDLRSGPRTLALTAGGVACEQVSPNDTYSPSYQFSCPVAASGTLAIRVTGQDFKLEGRADCK